MHYEMSMKYRSANCELIVWEDEMTISLSSLYAEFPNRGHGTKLMEKVVAQADLLEMAIILRVMAYGDEPRMSNTQLKEFYAKFGFESMSNDTMVRKTSRTNP